MTDYIYLLQNRLTPAQWRALEAVREAARAQNMPVFLVGGAVRDLTTGSPVRDLDFAVQGEVGLLTGDLEGKGAAVAGENATLGSVYLTFSGGVRAEVAPTLTVTYPTPGRAEVQSAVILDDLRRRDFTANAMAVSLNEGSYGLLLDPLNGTADIENRELRLVSAYGFIEQPALLLRAARLSERLGWALEARTQSRYQTSKEEGHIQAIADADRGYELEEIFHEEDPLSVIEHLTAEGWHEALFPALRVADGDRHGLDEVRDLVGQFEGQGLHPDPSAIFFPLVTAKMNEADRTALKAAFARQGFVRQIETLEARSKELASQLTSKAAASPSDAWRMITSADPEVLLYLAYSSRSGAVQSKIKAFLKDWPQMRQKIPYALMQEMRITPELPGYDKLLDDLFFALIDGKLDTTEATRAFLEPFSPPAPPQVNVRRRPAKAARGRGKRAADKAAEPVDTDETEPEDQDAEEGDDERKSSSRTEISDNDDTDEEDEGTPEPAEPEPEVRADTPSQAPEEGLAKKVASSSTVAPQTPPATTPPVTPAAPEKPAIKKAATKTAVPAKATSSAPAKAPAKAPAAGPRSAPKPPVKASPAVKVAAPTKKVPPPMTKTASKVAPQKAPAKASVKTATAVKSAAAKKSTPAKQVAVKQVIKVAAKKQAAKEAPAKRPAPAKSTPSKTAKKAAGKGRSGR